MNLVTLVLQALLELARSERPFERWLRGHMGEALPYTLHRIDEGWKETPQSKRLHHLPSECRTIAQTAIKHDTAFLTEP